MKRRVCYISGTRADFGLMRRTLEAIHRHPALDLEIVVTGMHLASEHGMTVHEIEAAALPIHARVEVPLHPTTGATMARAIAHEIEAFTEIWTRKTPHIVLVLGDRGEMLAAAIAAIHLNIPIAHVHGGERSGTVDEPVRHAISKLAHYHFTATAGARDRLVRMGELPAAVQVTGAPGLDGLCDQPAKPREALCAEQGLDPSRPIALLVYHPVVQRAAAAATEITTVLDGATITGAQLLCFAPNSDAGADAIVGVLAQQLKTNSQLRAVTHLPRADYVAWLAAADLMVGNSSSGIIEAASFGLPVVNVGDRQANRERNANTVDVALDAHEIERAIRAALRHGRFPRANIYGDGRTAPRIATLLSTLPLNPTVLHKGNAY